MRGIIDFLRRAGRFLFSGRHWAWVFYMTNISVGLAVVAIYLFGLYIPGIPIQIEGIFIPITAFLILFLIWYLVDRLGAVENSEILQDFITNYSLRWFDIALGIIGLLTIWLTYRYLLLNDAILTMGVLLIINAIISLLQIRSRYRMETLQRVTGDLPEED